MHKFINKYKFVILGILIFCIPFIHAFFFLEKTEIKDVFHEAFFICWLIFGFLLLPFIAVDWSLNFKITRYVIDKVEDSVCKYNRYKHKDQIKKYQKRYSLNIIKKILERKVDI